MPTIALVDDENSIRTSVSLALETDGFQVDAFNNGVEALEALESKHYDLGLFDIKMPKMDGNELLSKVRNSKIETLKNMPVIFLTSKDQEQDEIIGLRMGAADYITKPIKPKVLKSKIKSLLRRITKEEGDLIKLGSLIVDRSGYKVSLSGKDISLPRKEFELLFLLCSKPGKVFKREFILESVWGKDVVVGDRTIDVHIRKLREKIGDSCFKTVKGVGYKFQN